MTYSALMYIDTRLTKVLINVGDPWVFRPMDKIKAIVIDGAESAWKRVVDAGTSDIDVFRRDLFEIKPLEWHGWLSLVALRAKAWWYVKLTKWLISLNEIDGHKTYYWYEDARRPCVYRIGQQGYFKVDTWKEIKNHSVRDLQEFRRALLRVGVWGSI